MILAQQACECDRRPWRLRSGVPGPQPRRDRDRASGGELGMSVKLEPCRDEDFVGDLSTVAVIEHETPSDGVADCERATTALVLPVVDEDRPQRGPSVRRPLRIARGG